MGIDCHPLIKRLAIGVTRELRNYLPDLPSDLSTFYTHPGLMSSDVEMDDSRQSKTEVEPKLAITLMFLPQVSLGSALFVHKGKHYDWRPHEDNCRAYTKPSIIWRLSDEYGKGGNSHRK